MQNKKNYYRVELCGGIASGKTTLAKLLSCIESKPLLENFQTNPFWKAFYLNPGDYIFETEISFTLQHYHQIKAETSHGKLIACDYSFFLDLAYAEIGLKGSKLKTYKSVYKEIKRELQDPDLLIYLQCDPEAELERIRKRGRSVENSITLDFVSSLNKAVERQIRNIRRKLNVLTINSAEQNFAHNKKVKREVLDLINDSLINIKYGK